MSPAARSKLICGMEAKPSEVKEQLAEGRSTVANVDAVAAASANKPARWMINIAYAEHRGVKTVATSEK